MAVGVLAIAVSIGTALGVDEWNSRSARTSRDERVFECCSLTCSLERTGTNSGHT